MHRGTDFPFQKIAFSVSENLQFHFNMVEKWKFRFPIEIVHTKYWKFRLHRDVCYEYIRGSTEELHGKILQSSKSFIQAALCCMQWYGNGFN